MLRFFILITIIVSCIGTIRAQYVVQSRIYSSIGEQTTEWESGHYLDVSIHYWTRLKKYRVEFLPGIIFQYFPSNPENNNSLGANFPVSIYPLDFLNDCDCPTFSKKSYFFQKGFFIRLTPSWSTSLSKTSPDPYDQLLETGISVGLDLGFSDLLTITPILGYSKLHSLSTDLPSLNYAHAGVSFLFRHDYRRR